MKNATVDGLVGNLSHLIVEAVAIKGNQFVVVGDPWGEAGWEGPWSDCSKEWTKEWLEVLPELAHHEDPIDFGCLVSSRFSNQALDEIDTTRVWRLILD